MLIHKEVLRNCCRFAAVIVLAAFAAQPLIPWLRAEQFQKVGLLVAGTEKAKEVEVILSIDEAQLLILDKQSLNQLKMMPYKEIKTAEYSFSKQPLWEPKGVGVLAAPIFFVKGKKHWLTIRTESDYAVMRLDKNDYRLILTAFETRSGKKVVILPEEK